MIQQKQAAPYKVEPETPIRTYEIEDNGDVIMEETMVTKMWFKGREFLTYIRGHYDLIEEIEMKLSPETAKKLEESKKQLNADLKELNKMMPRIEEGIKKQAKENERTAIIENIKITLGMADDKINPDQFQDFWEKADQEMKDQLMKELNPDQKKKILKILAMKKKKSRGKK